ncbi:3-deoxy-manno-octulosonate cytidylyltransferase [Saccharospirillum impatiens]|uniref:3-deoxy-manno-octulosonate cytidylyltransferase n=1 Tax=Saccharospirillum impatiens TaxID=169438 RepID=UPI00040B63F0|nr:3-deoxy-manno-octulosonate cytidylyltransferase [Saccharospirillum impatiens]
MATIIMIPARYSSSRLPGKPLLDIEGRPMVVRVAMAVQACGADQVVVATDDERIRRVVSDSGFTAVMTRPDHPSGTDRLQETAEHLGLQPNDIIVNVQGDEPLMPVDNVLQVVRLLEQNPNAQVATLYEPITTLAMVANPNAVKLIQRQDGEVMYFSRAGIPYDRDATQTTPGDIWKRHIGLYAYRKSALDAFVGWPESLLERLEKLEQLRFMDNGAIIVADQAAKPVPAGVDTQADLDAVRALFAREVI